MAQHMEWNDLTETEQQKLLEFKHDHREQFPAGRRLMLVAAWVNNDREPHCQIHTETGPCMGRDVCECAVCARNVCTQHFTQNEVIPYQGYVYDYCVECARLTPEEREILLMVRTLLDQF